VLFTVGSKEDVKITDVASGRRTCSTHSPVWKSLVEAADWRDVYRKDDDLFAIFAVWDKDTRILAGAPYRQTTDAFSAVHIDTGLPDWMYLFCEYLTTGVGNEGFKKFSGSILEQRLRLIALDALLRFDFLI
jgi:hypothetical protein